MIQFKIAEGFGPTGSLLRKLAGDGHATKTGVVCWGRGHTGAEPTLNARAGAADKLQQLQKFQDAGILTPKFWLKVPSEPTDFPVLGRTLHHHGGKDIALLMQPGDAAWARSDYFMRYVPRADEFRVWIYRRRHLGTYRKVQTKANARIGANHRNGFSFQLVASEGIPEPLREIASKAVDCLGLDFGAVDILKGVDGKFYALEVNSAPGVEGENRQVITALAGKIKKWEALGFPKRNGAETGA